jgi:glycosyltransferase involved in cell wall biosynthesis
MPSLIKKLLIIGHVWPEPNSSAAGGRMIQLIKLFLKNNIEVIFCSPASETAFSFLLKTLGITQYQIKINDSDFDNLLKEINPDVVLFDRFMTEEKFGWRVAEVCPNALRILDTEDLHCLRYARQKAVLENTEFNTELLMNDYAKREIASVMRSDISLIISSFEMNLLQSFFKIDTQLLFYLPFLIDLKTIPVFKKIEERNHFVSIGNFLHEPNKDAVLQLKKSIWPLIRKKLPKAELHIYGAYVPESILQLNNPEEKFIIKGRAEDAINVIADAKVLLAPLRFGAGLKGKLMEAMLCGTPSVTTSIGAEGMSFNSSWGGAINDEPNDFANSAVELFVDEEKWKIAQNNGLDILSNFDSNRFETNFIKKINLLFQNLNEHRSSNFFGAMLLSNQLNSTKYFSRWIEEKNKKGNS